MTTVAKTDRFSKFKSSLWWHAAYSMCSGLFGALLIVVFLTGLMPVAATVKHLPWILGFNASLAGYTLLDRARENLRHKKRAGVGVGLLVAVLVCILLDVLTFKMTGMGLLDWPQMIIFSAIAAICGGLGAWLSLKYSRIKGN